MRRFWILWLGLASVLTGMTGCCSDPEEHHYSLSPSVLSLADYPIGGRFQVRHTDGTYASVSTMEVRHREELVGGCNDCCIREYEDVFTVVLRADTADLEVKVVLRQGGDRGVPVMPRIAVTANTSGIFYAELSEDGSCGVDPSLACLDSMRVADRPYYHVMAFANQGSNRAAITPDSLYYNAAFGILRISTYGAGDWDLVR